jgi:hypothetical protein
MIYPFMIRDRIPGQAGILRRLATIGAIAAVSAAAGACDGLFDVDNPVDILESDLDDPRSIPALSNSAEAAVVDAYGASLVYGELPGDGAIHIATNQGNLALDRGSLEEFNERAEELYNSMAAARWAATEVTRRLVALVEDPAKNAAVGRSYYWDALARITLADLHEEVPFDGGPPNTPAQVYEGAIQLLQSAADVSAAAGAQAYVAAAYATMARAYRSLYFETGETDITHFDRARAAAELALAAGPELRLDARYQPPGSSNRGYTSWDIGVFYDIMGDGYANQLDPVSGTRDPRIVHAEWSGLMSTFGDSVFQQLKYPGRESPVRVSSWQEAELIIAESHLLSGDPQGALPHINAVRAAAGLPDFTATGAQEVRDQLIYERKTEFWLELRRWQDMRYYDIVPERWDPAMKEEGVDRRFPVSLRERSTNPHYTG